MANEGGATLSQRVRDLFLQKTEGYWDHFESQRRDIGMGYRLLSEANYRSHEVFYHLAKGDTIAAEEEFEYARRAYLAIKELNIPTDILWQFVSSAGGELAEAAFGIRFYPLLIGEVTDARYIKLPSHKELDVTPQAYVSGAADFASECSKLAKMIWYYQKYESNKLNISKKDLFKNRLEIVEGINDFLKRFATMYPLVMSTTRRRGQGFARKRRTVADTILRNIEDFLE